MTLNEFLLARIDDDEVPGKTGDEATFNAAATERPQRPQRPFDPVVILAECQAKRAVVSTSCGCTAPIRGH
jgi:hypothetical protein